MQVSNVATSVSSKSSSKKAFSVAEKQEVLKKYAHLEGQLSKNAYIKLDASNTISANVSNVDTKNETISLSIKIDWTKFGVAESDLEVWSDAVVSYVGVNIQNCKDPNGIAAFLLKYDGAKIETVDQNGESAYLYHENGFDRNSKFSETSQWYVVGGSEWRVYIALGLQFHVNGKETSVTEGFSMVKFGTLSRLSANNLPLDVHVRGNLPVVKSGSKVYERPVFDSRFQ